MDLLTYLLARQGTVKLKGGKIPSEVLPSYIDDVIEGFFNPADFQFYKKKTHPITGEPVYSEPITGELGKIYVDEDSSYTYRYGIVTKKFIQIGGPDYLNNKPDGTHYLIDDDGKLTTTYRAQYVVRYGIEQTAANFNASANERIFSKINAELITETSSNGYNPVEAITCVPCGRDANNQYVQKPGLPCLYYNEYEYGFLDYENRQIYIVPCAVDAQHTYRVVPLYDTQFPAKGSTSQNPLTADALAVWFYEEGDNYGNIVEKIIRQTFVNADVLRAITAQEMQAVHSLVEAIPLEAVPANLSAGNPLVDMQTLEERLSWKSVVDPTPTPTIYTVTYYDGETGEWLNEETVTEGLVASDIPSGYDYWTNGANRDDPQFDFASEAIWYSTSFYGWHNEEEQVEP